LFSIVGIVIVMMGIDNYEKTWRVDTHSKGTSFLVMLFVIIIMIILAVLKRASMQNYTNSMDQLRIDFVYPPGYTEILSDEDSNEIDPAMLEELKWYGLTEKIEEIDLQANKAFQVICGDPINKLEPEKVAEALKEIYNNRLALYSRGEGWHFGIASFDRYVRYRVRDSQTKREVEYNTREIVIAFPVSIRDSLKLRKMKVPSGGFVVDHSHAERIKLIYKTTILGRIPFYILNDSGYFDDINKPTNPADGADLGSGIIDAISYLHNRFMIKISSDLQDLDTMRANAEEAQDNMKKDEAVQVAHFDLGDDIQRVEKEIRKMRMSPKKEEMPVFWAVILLIAIPGWVLWILSEYAGL